jgi:hypothetical protein
LAQRLTEWGKAHLFLIRRAARSDFFSSASTTTTTDAAAAAKEYKEQLADAVEW